MARRSKRFCIVTQTGYLGCDMTKPQARKALATEVKAAAASCRRGEGGRKRACTVIGSVRKGDVEIRIGGRQGYHLWQRYGIREDRS